MRHAPPQIVIAVGDPDLRDLIVDVLATEGYRALACSRPACPAALAEHDPSLIIVDLCLVAPVRGWQLLAALRGAPATRSTPVLALTADTMLLGERRAQLDAWAVRVHPLPFDLDALLGAVRDALQCAAPH